MSMTPMLNLNCIFSPLFKIVNKGYPLKRFSPPHNIGLAALSPTRWARVPEGEGWMPCHMLAISEASRQAGKQAGRQADRLTGRQAGRQTGG